MNASQNDREKLVDLIKDIHVAMLTTQHDDQLRSRPMATLKSEADGVLWFMTSNQTEKVDELKEDSAINVSFSDPGHNRYVSVTGHARIVRDIEMQKKLWNPYAKVWFEGPEDPNIVLLKVIVDGAEYWDGPGNIVTKLFAIVKSVITGDDSSLAENKTIG